MPASRNCSFQRPPFGNLLAILLWLPHKPRIEAGVEAGAAGHREAEGQRKHSNRWRLAFVGIEPLRQRGGVAELARGRRDKRPEPRRFTVRGGLEWPYVAVWEGHVMLSEHPAPADDYCMGIFSGRQQEFHAALCPLVNICPSELCDSGLTACKPLLHVSWHVPNESLSVPAWSCRQHRRQAAKRRCLRQARNCKDCAILRPCALEASGGDS